jgi:ribosomal-protein-alanine N-acetyltransferase
MNLLQAKKEIHNRRMLLSDLDSVMEIEPVAFGEHHWSRENFSQELSNNLALYLVSELVGQIVAYAGAWIIHDEMHIVTLGVDPNFRRKNIAESLIVALLDQAIINKVKGVTLEVRVSNIAAQKLYEKYGFQRMGTRKRYYQDNYEDAFLLWTEDIQDEKFQKLFKENITKLQA